MNSSKTGMRNLLAIVIALICLAVIPLTAHATDNAIKASKKRLVLMPLLVAAEDQNLKNVMETALIEGLQLNYKVYSGELVEQKVHEIFLRESRLTSHKECDEMHCMQEIAATFQSKLIAIANVTKRSDGYFLALRIQNIFSNLVVYSNSILCKNCDSYNVMVDKLKELSNSSASVYQQNYPSSQQQKTQIVAGTKHTITFRDCASCPEMLVIPAGSFEMGSHIFEAGQHNEEPVHRVTFSQNFAMGKTEITRGQFAAFVNATGYNAGDKCWTLEDGWKERSGRNWSKPGFSQENSHPAVCINWKDAKAYTEWLSYKTGKPYRLPSEAEWEYAARGNTHTERYWGDSLDQACGYANVMDATSKAQMPESTWPAYNCSDNFVCTAPAGSFKPNPFGLYDMIGNVWEWVEDNYHENYNGAPGDGRAWEGNDEKRVLRGGSWMNGPVSARSAGRVRNKPESRNYSYGFRLARTLP